MKKTILALVMFMFFAPAFAQESSDDIRIIQSIYGKEKRDLVGQFLALSPEDLAKFAPIYDAYEVERKEIAKQRLENIAEYILVYGTADEKEIDKLTLNNLKLNSHSDKMMAKYYAKVKKAVGTKNAAKFFQIENYLALSVRMSIWDNIPFLDELDNK